MSNLNQNTVDLQAILDAVNALPESTDLTPIIEALAEKGQTVPDGATVDVLASLIAAIEAGGGSVLTGTFTPSDDVGAYTFEHNGLTDPNVLAIFALTANESNTIQSPLIIQSLPIGIALQIAGTPASGSVHKLTTTDASFPTSQTHGYFMARKGLKHTLYPARSSSYGHKFLGGVTYFWVIAKV